MKIWQAHGAGIENLKLTDIDVPLPDDAEVLVRVSAVSLNYRDLLMIENDGYARFGLPFTPCSDFAGEVAALGAGVTRFAIGDRVINNFNAGWIDGPPPRIHGEVASFGGSINGTLAEYVVVPAEWLVPTPASLSDAEASSLPCTGLTAWTSLIELGRLQPGQTVVVQGTGSFSLFALQIAATVGAEVIVTTTSTAKAERAKALGATHAIIRDEDPSWDSQIMAITAGRGADHILEVAGGTNLGRSIQALAAGGRISLIGVMEGFDSSFPSVPAIHASAIIQAVYVGHRRSLECFVRAVDATRLKPVIDSRFGMADFPDALRRLASGPFGKVVIDIR